MHYSSGLQGGILGGLIGAFAGLGMCMWVLPDDWSLFPGDTILLGVVLCGSLGLIYGEAIRRMAQTPLGLVLVARPSQVRVD